MFMIGIQALMHDLRVFARQHATVLLTIPRQFVLLFELPFLKEILQFQYDYLLKQ